MSFNDSDDLSYNPFAEQDDYSAYSGGSNIAQGHYSSAYLHKAPNSPPSLRHRRSSSTDHVKRNGSQGKRVGPRFEVQIQVPHSAGLHPLKSALAKIDSSSVEDLGNTRPSLSRLVNEGSFGNTTAVEHDVNSEGSSTPPEDEKDVIIHQVCWYVSSTLFHLHD